MFAAEARALTENARQAKNAWTVLLKRLKKPQKKAKIELFLMKRKNLPSLMKIEK